MLAFHLANGLVCAGGMGKSTLARAMFNELLPSFGGHRSAEVCLDLDGKPLSTDAYNKLLKSLGIDALSKGSDSAIRRALAKRLQKGDILLLVDNLSSKDQLDQVLPCLPYSLGQGSYLIVTSREKSKLIMAGVSEAAIFEMTPMDPAAALQLFRLHALGPSKQGTARGHLPDLPSPNLQVRLTCSFNTVLHAPSSLVPVDLFACAAACKLVQLRRHGC